MVTLYASDEHRRARLARRHGLAAEARAAGIRQAAAAMTALHATDQSAIHLALAARVDDLTVADVDRVLFDDRSLVRVMAMRRTVWAVGRDLLPSVLASAGARVAAEQTRALGRLGLDPAWLAGARRRLVTLLDARPLSAKEIREALPELDEKVTVGSGRWTQQVAVLTQLLPLFAAEGVIVRGPNAGHWRLTRPVWASMGSWLGEDLTIPSADEGYANLVRRWLWTFGPGTEDDLVWWLGATKRAARRALSDVEAVAVTLDDGHIGWVLPDDTADLERPVVAVDPWAALTPTLDPTLMGWRRRDWYLDPIHTRRLFDTMGNGTQALWVDGRVAGTWLQDDDGRVEVRPFGSVPGSLVAAAVARLDAFLDGDVVPNVYRAQAAASLPLP